MFKTVDAHNVRVAVFLLNEKARTGQHVQNVQKVLNVQHVQSARSVQHVQHVNMLARLPFAGPLATGGKPTFDHSGPLGSRPQKGSAEPQEWSTSLKGSAEHFEHFGTKSANCSTYSECSNFSKFVSTPCRVSQGDRPHVKHFEHFEQWERSGHFAHIWQS